MFDRYIFHLPNKIVAPILIICTLYQSETTFDTIRQEAYPYNVFTKNHVLLCCVWNFLVPGSLFWLYLIMQGAKLLACLSLAISVNLESYCSELCPIIFKCFIIKIFERWFICISPFLNNQCIFSILIQILSILTIYFHKFTFMAILWKLRLDLYVTGNFTKVGYSIFISILFLIF